LDCVFTWTRLDLSFNTVTRRRLILNRVVGEGHASANSVSDHQVLFLAPVAQYCRKQL
jgi:hypothetical protein